MTEENVKTCIPDRLPDIKVDWMSLVSKMGEANRAVSKFNGILFGLSNPELLLSPLMNTEATISSKMEGTQVDTIDVLKFEAGVEEPSEARTNDIKEVLNYREAIKFGIESLKNRSLNLALIKELHCILLTGVRGERKTPGVFREEQNYIGRQSLGISKARFVPPVHFIVPEYMDNLVDYINFDEKDILVQAAVLHGQFEIIHPFKDGNGRLGRMLIPLFLFQKKVISKPYLYISKYLEKNEMLYKDSLLSITNNNDWTQWVSLFLDAIIWQSEYNFRLANEILALYEKTKDKVLNITASQYAVPLIDSIFKMPIFRPHKLNLTPPPSRGTVYKLLQSLEENDIIKVGIPSAGRTGKTYVFSDLMNIVEDTDIF